MADSGLHDGGQTVPGRLPHISEGRLVTPTTNIFPGSAQPLPPRWGATNTIKWRAKCRGGPPGGAAPARPFKRYAGDQEGWGPASGKIGPPAGPPSPAAGSPALAQEPGQPPAPAGGDFPATQVTQPA